MTSPFTYDFGYSWSVRYAMLFPFVLAGAAALFAVWRAWPRWVSVPLLVIALHGPGPLDRAF